MRDPRFVILEQLNSKLSTLLIPVYSVIPDDTPTPFVYIGDIQLSEIQNKTHFQLGGFATIEVYSGTNAWVGSIAPLLTSLDNIKVALRPNKNSVLDLSPKFNMSYWKLQSDTGLIQYSTTERLFVATLQFSFEITDLGVVTPTEDVVHYGVPVTHQGEQVTHTNT